MWGNCPLMMQGKQPTRATWERRQTEKLLEAVITSASLIWSESVIRATTHQSHHSSVDSTTPREVPLPCWLITRRRTPVSWGHGKVFYFLLPFSPSPLFLYPFLNSFPLSPFFFSFLPSTSSYYAVLTTWALKIPKETQLHREKSGDGGRTN